MHSMLVGSQKRAWTFKQVQRPFALHGRVKNSAGVITSRPNGLEENHCAVTPPPETSIEDPLNVTRTGWEESASRVGNTDRSDVLNCRED